MINISSGLDTEICDFLMGWHRLEKKLEGYAIVDFNLTGHESSKLYQDRSDVLKDVQRLKNEVETSCPHTFARLNAQEICLRAIMGEKFDFKTYIEMTMGYTPRFFTEDEIQLQKNIFIELLNKQDMVFDGHVKEELNKRDEITEQGAKKLFRDIYDGNRSVMETVLGQEIPKAHLTIQVEHHDAYWINWISGENGHFTLAFNTKHFAPFSKSKCTHTAIHELLAHLIQASVWRQKILEGHMAKHFGMTTIHGPESYLMEGLAQNIGRFLDIPETRDPFYKIREQQAFYKFMILNNAEMMFANGENIEKALDYLVTHCPFLKRDEEKEDLESWISDPILKPYQHSYRMSCFDFYQISQNLDEAGKKNFLRQTYNHWLMAADLRQQKTNTLKLSLIPR